MRKPRKNPTRRKQQLTAILANGPQMIDDICRQMGLAKQSVQQYLNYYSNDFERIEPAEKGKAVWKLKKP